MIPKIIHYIWLGDPEKKPKMLADCIESWKKFCPDYEIKEWNEKNFDFSDSPYAMEAYKLKKYAFVADYIRVRLLQEYGGIYLDTDVEVTKSFDDLLDRDFIVSFENEVYVETAVIGAKPNHPFSQVLVDFYRKYPFVYAGKPDTTPAPVLWTHLLKKHYGMKLKNSLQVLNSNAEGESITVYPKDYFAPINYTSREMTKTENTHTIHYFTATWFTGKLKKREKFLKGVHKVFGESFFAMCTKAYVKSIINKMNKRVKKINKIKKGKSQAVRA